MEDVCNSQMCALYCLHSVISQPQPWHGEEGPISAAGTVFFFQLCCILAAEENDSDPQCQHNGYIFHIYVLSVKELKKKKKGKICIITIQCWLPQKVAAYRHWLFC